MRVRFIVLVTAVLLFSALIMVPQIIEVTRAKAAAAANSRATTVTGSPVQGRRPEMTVGESIRNDTSPPIRELKQQPVFESKREANANPKIPHFHKDTPDRVVQKTVAVTDLMASAMPTALTNFDGMGFPGVTCNCAPPDTNGEVGATQYVQMVNKGFQVY